MNPQGILHLLLIISFHPNLLRNRFKENIFKKEILMFFVMILYRKGFIEVYKNFGNLFKKIYSKVIKITYGKKPNDYLTNKFLKENKN
jgi:hypothetical protein